MADIFALNHIPKTGITTLVNAVLPAEDGSFVKLSINDANFNIEYIDMAIMERGSRYSSILIEGHDAYGLHNQINNIKYLSIIRDPFDFAISLHYWFAGMENWKMLQDKKRMIDEISNMLMEENEKFGFHNNFQSKYLLRGKFDDDFHEDLTENDVMGLIDKKYHFIGLFEELETSYFLICNILNVSNFSTPQQKERETLMRPTSDQFSSEIVNIFKKNNKMDYAVYNFFKSSFYNFCKKLSINEEKQQEIRNHFRARMDPRKIEVGCYTGENNINISNDEESFTALLYSHRENSK